MKSVKSRFSCLALVFILFLAISCNHDTGEMTYVELDGFVLVEAENFQTQTNDAVRKWYVFTENNTPEIAPDVDPVHLEGASGKGYIEILPDTRATHDDKLIRGENFMPDAGEMAILSYRVKFNNPGKYYVWARIYSTGTEDNGLHVGINDTWPESGQRMQWCEGKNQWTWASKQRTEENHCGEEKLIYLEIDEPGIHTIQFSMREDGTEFDAWAMTMEYNEPKVKE